MKEVELGIFPYFRGHKLTEEDLIVRKHILNLMCQFETNWSQPEQQCAIVYETANHLQEMEQDGLVELAPFSLKITEKGRQFVRNICMAFDARLWRKQPDTAIFSQTV